MEKWVGNTQDLVNKIHEYEAYLQKVISELRQQQSTLVQGSEAWNTINDKIASAVDQARHLRMEANNLISDMLNSIVEANQASNEASLQAYEASINAQISALETQAKATEDAIQGQIDSLESQEEAMEKRYEARQKAIDEKEERYMEQSNAKIDAIRKEIEALEKQNEIETEEEERQKRILDIQKLREQLQNKMNQKTVQQLTQQEDGTWQFEYTYDEAEVQSIQDQIKQQEEDFAKWEQDNQLKHQKELLEARIQAEEQVQEEQKKSFDAQREALEEQMNSEKEAFENRRKTLENQLEAERNAYEQQRQALEQSLEAQRQQMEQNNKQMEDMVKQLLDAIKNNVDGSTDDLIQTLGEKLGLAKEQIQELLDLSRQAQQASNQINSQMPGGNSSSNYGELPNGGYYYYGEGFAGGGVVDFTGGTTVHGTPTQSKVVFNSSQAKKLYDWVRNLPALPKLANFMNIPTSKTSEKKENHFHIARLELPNITNESGLKKVWDDLELLSHQYNPA
jgi:chemotaxis protein histidine kinase CheA